MLLAGAIITVLASFLDTVGDASAWGRGLSTLKLVPIYAIVVGGVVALRRFARAELPERVGAFTWPHLFVAISFFGMVMALAWLFVPSNPGVGLYAMALGSVVMFVGAVSELRAASRRLHGWSPPPRSGRDTDARRLRGPRGRCAHADRIVPRVLRAPRRWR